MKFFEPILSKVQEEKNKALSVCAIGETGKGKSSLFNALLGAKLETSDVAPCTKNVQKVILKARSGCEIIFIDLPGIGENSSSDSKYLELYLEQIIECDIVLLAIQADERSVTFTLNSLNQLFDKIDDNDEIKSAILRKITIVLTKADLLCTSPWILAKYDNYGMFTPSKPTRQILEQKERYFQDTFYGSFRKYVKAKVSLDKNPRITEPGFNFRDGVLEYDGYLTNTEFERLKDKYPDKLSILGKIYDNYRIVPVSARFRFNLVLLMKVIVSKIGQEAVIRFSNYTSNDDLNKVDLNTAKSFRNIIIFDPNKELKVFDLCDLQL
jgi:GTP-binding protein EngB required for normal cell division